MRPAHSTMNPSLSLTLAAVLTLLAAVAPAADRSPNVVLILCDNLGYGDIQVTNPAAKQPTPQLKRLAEEGTFFSHAYCAATVCTPSRAALQTGCYPRRVGLDRVPVEKGNGHVLTPVSKYGLHPDEITLAELLRPAGYRSICIGKWHLGDQLPFLPLAQGYDEFYGIPYSDNMVGNVKSRIPPLPLMEGNEVVEAPADVRTLVRRGTERAVRFITENQHRPFFLYFPQITPGSTAAPPTHPDFQGRSSNGPWGDSVMELDWSTGRLLDTLDKLGLSENTLVLFTNDNGAPQQRKRGGSNDPLSGEAYSVTEGGMRVPLLARWKGRVPAGRECREVVNLIDVFPTLAALAGASLPADRVIDGQDISGLLFGQPAAADPRRAVYFWHIDDLQAVRSGPWKLYRGGDRLVGFGANRQRKEAKLFHLLDDPTEMHNRISDQPAIADELERLARQMIGDLGEGGQRGKGCRPVGLIENPTPRKLPAK